MCECMQAYTTLCVFRLVNMMRAYFIFSCPCASVPAEVYMYIHTQTHVNNTLHNILCSVSGPPVPQRRQTCSIKTPALIERDSPHKRAPPPVKPKTFKPYTDEKFQGLCQKDL